VSVRFTPAAQRQLLEALEFLAARRPSAARAFLQRVRARLEVLEDYSQAGRRVPEFPELPVREVLVPPYRLFYRVRESGVWLVGVWHDARLPREPE